MSEKPGLVVASYNFDGDLRCVDIFIRADGTYGFEVYRRDPEDGRGWYVIGGFSVLVFKSEAKACEMAIQRVNGFRAIFENEEKL